MSSRRSSGAPTAYSTRVMVGQQLGVAHVLADLDVR